MSGVRIFLEFRGILAQRHGIWLAILVALRCGKLFLRERFLGVWIQFIFLELECSFVTSFLSGFANCRFWKLLDLLNRFFLHQFCSGLRGKRVSRLLSWRLCIAAAQ